MILFNFDKFNKLRDYIGNVDDVISTTLKLKFNLLLSDLQFQKIRNSLTLLLLLRLKIIQIRFNFVHLSLSAISSSFNILLKIKIL